MNWLKQFNETLDFIENNIAEVIEPKDIEKISYSSYFHFSKMFFILAGLNVQEYIRYRRLSLAAAELVTTDTKVIDVAYKYCYQTPESFSKAFKRFHGVSPSKAKHGSIKLKSYPKLAFELNVRGGSKMDYQIIKKGKLSFIGYEKEVTSVNGENFKIIPAFWQEVMADGRFQKMIQNVRTEMGVVGVCYDYDFETSKFKYMIGIEDTGLEVENGVKIEFDSEIYASFQVKGALPDSFQKTVKYIYNEWFPSSDYEQVNGCEIEVYPEGDTQSEDYVCYYLVPVTKK